MATKAPKTKKAVPVKPAASSHSQLQRVLGEATVKWLSTAIFPMYDRDSNGPTHVIYHPPTPKLKRDVDLLFVKKVIVWAPDVMWKSFLKRKCIKCTKCNDSARVNSHGWSPDPRWGAWYWGAHVANFEEVPLLSVLPCVQRTR